MLKAFLLIPLFQKNAKKPDQKAKKLAHFQLAFNLSEENVLSFWDRILKLVAVRKGVKHFASFEDLEQMISDKRGPSSMIHSLYVCI